MPLPKPCEHNAKKRCSACQRAANREAKRKKYAENPSLLVQRTQQWRDQNPGKRAAAERKARADNPVKHNSYHKDWRARRTKSAKARANETHKTWKRNNRKKVRAYQHKAYGIVWAPGQTFEQVIVGQNYICAGGCGRNLKELSSQQVHVDHDKTIADRPNVRGVLCHRCNMGAGLLGDNAVGVGKMLNYLQNPLHGRLA